MLVPSSKTDSIKPEQNSNPQSKSEIDDLKHYSFNSTESSNEVSQKKQKYIFDSNNKSCEINLYLNEDKINIRINLLHKDKEEYFYESDITQEQLKINNNVFKLCNNIEDSFEYLNYLFSDKQNQLIIKEENSIIKLEKKIKLSPPLRLEIPQKKQKFLHQNLSLFNNEKNSENENYAKNELNQNDIQKNKINNNDDSDNGVLCVKIIEYKDEENSDDSMNISLEKIISKKNNIIKNDNSSDNNKANNMDIIELSEEQEKKEKQFAKSHNNLIHISKIKSLPSLVKNNYDSLLLNKKRTTDSNSSDESFNSITNENNPINNYIFSSKKQKKNLEKENFLKIFCDDNAVNNEKSSEKFFKRIQKRLNLEKLKKKEVNNNMENGEINQENNNIVMNIENKKEDEEEVDDDDLLYGNKNKKDIIDDIHALSPKNSPKLTPSGYYYNYFNLDNNKEFSLNLERNISQDSLSKNSSSNSLSRNYKNCISGFQKIQLKDNDFINNKNINSNNNYIPSKFKNNNNENIAMDIPNNWNINNSLNLIGSLIDNNKNINQIKQIKRDKSYKIIHKNKIELQNTEIPFFLRNDNNNLNNSFSIESDIISGYSEFDFIFNYLKIKFNKEINDTIRIYQSRMDGPTANDFHRLCDGNTNLLVLIKTTDGKKIGGYTSIGFNSFNRSYHDDTAFIFSIDKREIYPNIKGKTAVDSFYNLGPCFSGDSIKIFDNFLKEGGVTTRESENFETNEIYQINGGKKAFGVEEIEVLEFLEKKDDDNI